MTKQAEKIIWWAMAGYPTVYYDCMIKKDMRDIPLKFWIEAERIVKEILL